jgi:hypothetical protein
MSIIRITTVAAAFAIAAAAAASVPVASAKGGPGVRVSGACTQSSSAKLKLSRDDGGRIEVEFEVDQNRNGVPWKVTLRRNGALVASTTATTHAPSGSFSVRRLIAGAPATDRITALATRSSGERCTAHAAV